METSPPGQVQAAWAISPAGDGEPRPAIRGLVDADRQMAIGGLLPTLTVRGEPPVPVVNCKGVHRVTANHAMNRAKYEAVRIGRVDDSRVMVMEFLAYWLSWWPGRRLRCSQ